MPKKDLTTVSQAPRPSDDPASPAAGKWYWVGRKGQADERWLGCVRHLGSNYALLVGPSKSHAGSLHCDRIHFDGFWEVCEWEPNPDPIVQGRVTMHWQQAQGYLREITALAAQLGVAPHQAIAGPAEETQALSLRQGDRAQEYKKALILAKTKTLPELFQHVKHENEMAASWMKAQLIPLEAEAATMGGLIDRIEDRIFSVELYAGLVESVECIKEGKPAGNDEKIRLMQRRHYMDEECLAAYETGGMEYKDLKAFEKWLLKPATFTRIMPFERTILAFRVRRTEKERVVHTIKQFVKVMGDADADLLTFLYIRNGEQCFRLSTELDFGARLFPEQDRKWLVQGKLWARMFCDSVNEVITDDEYQGKLEDEAKAKAKNAKLPKAQRSWDSFDRIKRDYHMFSPASVYYDDIAAHLSKQVKEHNRLVLVLQGLLDRSPVLHPHPPWQIWTAAGFNAALELIYDDSRALSAGEAPDFEAYRARLNHYLKDGSLTVGQEVAWEIREAGRENGRQQRDWRRRGEPYYHKRYRPSGDPGPGTITTVARYKRGNKAVVYKWARESQSWNRPTREIPCSLITGTENVLNIDAYKPGDFRLFYDDPRTRVDYLRWAYLLLEAEECHAGNRDIKPNPIERDDSLVIAPTPTERVVDLKKRKKRKPMRDRWVGS